LNNNLKTETNDNLNIKYITLFAISFLVLGFFSAVLAGDTSLYGELVRPPLSPPPIVFGIVWSILYVIIGGVTGAVYSFDGEYDPKDRENALWFMCLGFVFNLLWSPLYFGKGQLLAALIDIAVMFVLTLEAYKNINRIKKLYAYLLIPYLVWLLFAFYLNLGTIILN